MAAAPESEDEMKEQVGNLVADDEWEGLGMELTELVRTAVLQDLKRTSRDFLGKDEYKGKWRCILILSWSTIETN